MRTSRVLREAPDVRRPIRIRRKSSLDEKERRERGNKLVNNAEILLSNKKLIQICII